MSQRMDIECSGPDADEEVQLRYAALEALRVRPVAFSTRQLARWRVCLIVAISLLLLVSACGTGNGTGSAGDVAPDSSDTSSSQQSNELEAPEHVEPSQDGLIEEVSDEAVAVDASLEDADEITQVDRQPATSDEFPHGHWSGPGRIVIDSYDYCSPDFSRQYVESTSALFDVDVWVQEPHSNDHNPVSFSIYATPHHTEHSFSAESSLIGITPTGREAILIYWDITLDGTGISARLTDRYAGHGNAPANFLNAWQYTVPCRPELGSMMMPYTFAVGVELFGELGSEDGRLVVQGITTNEMREFVIEMDLVREE